MKVVDKEEGATVSDELETIQYLTFSMADELIAVDGARVLEILELADLANETPLPDFMRGVVSLRGCPVPVIDLRLSFAMGEPVQTVGSFNVVVELAKDGENVVLQASNDEGRQVIENRFQVKPHRIGCVAASVKKISISCPEFCSMLLPLRKHFPQKALTGAL
jgi:chemotaxis signal transduction protein